MPLGGHNADFFWTDVMPEAYDGALCADDHVGYIWVVGRPLTGNGYAPKKIKIELTSLGEEQVVMDFEDKG